MRINTKTNSLDLDKREHKTLADCKALLLQIAKHGDDELMGRADVGADQIAAVQAWISGMAQKDRIQEEIEADI